MKMGGIYGLCYYTRVFTNFYIFVMDTGFIQGSAFSCLNICDLEFDLWRSCKVKLKVAILKVIYEFLLVFNSNLRPNSIQ